MLLGTPLALIDDGQTTTPMPGYTFGHAFRVTLSGSGIGSRTLPQQRAFRAAPSHKEEF